MSKDFLGQEINIGDKVVFCEIGYRNFLIGNIKKITEKMVIIEHSETNYSETTKQAHNQVIKINI